MTLDPSHSELHKDKRESSVPSSFKYCSLGGDLLLTMFPVADEPLIVKPSAVCPRPLSCSQLVALCFPLSIAILLSFILAMTNQKSLKPSPQM